MVVASDRHSTDGPEWAFRIGLDWTGLDWTGLDWVEDSATQDRPSGVFPTPKVANYEGNWESVNGEMRSVLS